MIIVEFRVDEQSLQEDLRCDPKTADIATIEETYFLMPVRLSISSCELLAPTGWAPLPILGFAIRLHEAARQIRTALVAHCYIAGGGDLQLRRSDGSDKISIRSPVAIAECGVRELDIASRRFLEDVLTFLRERVDGISSHKHWEEWVSEVGGEGQIDRLPV